MAGIWEQIGAAVAKNVDLAALADRGWKLVEPKVDAIVDKYTPIVIDKLMAALPVIVATAVKAAVEPILEADPDIPGVSDVFDLSETIRKAINGDKNIPIHIPILSDIMRGGQQ